MGSEKNIFRKDNFVLMFVSTTWKLYPSSAKLVISIEREARFCLHPASIQTIISSAKQFMLQQSIMPRQFHFSNMDNEAAARLPKRNGIYRFVRRDCAGVLALKLFPLLLQTQTL